ncbi:hypothetical protein [Sporichthya polymorpha]|uniref:hypothetical protein n=1 Tax=Sporichthya polymorpha TaxID=35751 RepID=UPI00036A927A|nr:hypothetical protein [Sporichthya polymorpha]
MGQETPELTSDCISGSGRPAFPTVSPTLSAVIQDLDTAGGAESSSFDAQVYELNGSVPLDDLASNPALVASGRSGTVPEGAAGAWQVPIALTEGVTYKWRARSTDSTTSPVWSEFCEFTIAGLEDMPPLPVEQYSESMDGPILVLPGQLAPEEETVGTLSLADCTDSCWTKGWENLPDANEPEDEMMSAAGVAMPTKWDDACDPTRLEEQAAHFRGFVQFDRRKACEFEYWTYHASPSRAKALGKFKTKMWAKGTKWYVDFDVRFDPGRSQAPAIPSVLKMTVQCPQCSSVKQASMHWADDNVPSPYHWEGRAELSVSVSERQAKTFRPQVVVDASAPGQLPAAFLDTMPRTRCDDILYTTRNPGCILPDYVPTFRIRLDRYKAVADHVDWAQQAGLPGSPAEGRPLTRLKNKRKRENNRDIACPDSFGALVVDGVKYWCDEYPFAATYQGASSGGGGRTFPGCRVPPTTSVPYALAEHAYRREGWTRCYVPAKQNAGEGAARRNWQDNERVLDGDGFYVAFKD